MCHCIYKSCAVTFCILPLLLQQHQDRLQLTIVNSMLHIWFTHLNTSYFFFNKIFYAFYLKPSHWCVKFFVVLKACNKHKSKLYVHAYVYVNSYQFSVFRIVQDLDIVGHRPVSLSHGRTISVQQQRHSHTQNKITTPKHTAQYIYETGKNQ